MPIRLMPRRCRPARLAALVLALGAAAACGKKGPPLPPLLSVPTAPSDVSARRSGDQVVIRFTIPRANQSGRQPADIERVEVYAWTPPDPTAAASTPGGPAGVGRGTGPAARADLRPEQVFKFAKLVATVPVRKPPPPPPERKEGEPPPPPPPPPTGPGLDQGAPAEVTDTLTAQDANPIEVPFKSPKTKPPKVRAVVVTPPDVGPPLPPLPSRVYVVVGVNHRGRRGAMSQPVRVPLWTPPPPPADLAATVREGAVDLAWSPPEGLRHPLVLNPSPTPVAAPTTRGGAAGVPAASPPPGAAPPPRRGADDEDEDDAAAQARRDAAMQQAAEARAAAAQAAGQAPPEAAPPSAAPGTDAPAAANAAPSPAGATAPGQQGSPGVPLVDASGLLRSRVPFPWPPIASGFTVYEVTPPRSTPQGVPAPPAVQPFPKPLTPAPLKVANFTDPRLEYAVTRCYAVRTSETVGTLTVESASSPPVCISPTDTFAPAAPKSLGAVSSEGAINLIWEPGSEPDLAGYIVLRGVGDGPLQPITPAAIRETTFRDEKVRRGTRYTYAVVAIDTATPPNRSPESNHVQETAR